MASGDHIYVQRPLGYTHHGIDCGDGTVIHFTGEPGQKVDAAIARTTTDDFARGSIIHLREYSRRLPVNDIVTSARSELGSRGYNLVTNNCEHFAVWCSTGKRASDQVRAVGSGTVSGAAGVVSAGTTVATLGAAGAVNGLSGAGVMSALGSVGSFTSVGAAAGPAVLGLVPAALSVGAVHVALRSDDTLPAAENESRRDGRRAAVVVASSVTLGGVAAISTAGVSGLSAAGITSGLAAIGSVAGGGMVAGTVMVAAAPAVAAGTLGFGVYLAARRLRGVRRVVWSPPSPTMTDPEGGSPAS